MVFFGKFSEDKFVEGYIVAFEDDGVPKGIVKANEKDNKITGGKNIDEVTGAKMTEVMSSFRDAILDTDYFGEVYNKFKDIVMFQNKEMKNPEIFNAENYVKIMTIGPKHHKITIFDKISKSIKY